MDRILERLSATLAGAGRNPVSPEQQARNHAVRMHRHELRYQFRCEFVPNARLVEKVGTLSKETGYLFGLLDCNVAIASCPPIDASTPYSAPAEGSPSIAQ
jgi:hypothetical protein